MIEVDRLTRRYGARTAVDGVSFHVPRGEIVGLLGPNGAGKTTTLRMLAGCLHPTDGSARIAGHDLLHDGAAARAQLGYLPERPPLYDDMSVADYLDHAARLRQVPPPRRADAVASAIADCTLGEVEGRLIGQLSTGFRQRVGVAQAIVHRPAVLVLDEPTAGLDPAQMRSMRTLLGALRGRHTILLSTHLLSEVTASCDRVVILARGRVVAAGREDEVRRELGALRRFRIRVRDDRAACAQALRALSAVQDVDGSGSELTVTLHGDAEDDAMAVVNGVATQFGLLRSAPVDALEELFLTAVDRGGPR